MVVAWVPVVDIARHQGAVDFRRMRAAGVEGLILRISHGLVLDERVDGYWNGAVAAGFPVSHIGFYPFINPKRSSGAQAAAFAVGHIQRITGGLDFFYMIDVENYAPETPNVGAFPVYGPTFAAHLRGHLDMVAQLAPAARRLAYGNRAYWNGPVPGTRGEWVGDDLLASSLEWIVARYPAYSDQAYARLGYPPEPGSWADWAFHAQPVGPLPPRGASWKGWQFSAGWNRQGARYGASSRDLDLDFIHPEAWARWTGLLVKPPIPEPDKPPVPPLPGPVVPGGSMSALVTPVRVYDSREPTAPWGGAKHGAGDTLHVPFPAAPPGVGAAIINITVADPAPAGVVVVWGDGAQPGTSNLNMNGHNDANLAVVPLTAAGGVNVFTSAPTHVLIDLQGWA